MYCLAVHFGSIKNCLRSRYLPGWGTMNCTFAKCVGALADQFFVLRPYLFRARHDLQHAAVGGIGVRRQDQRRAKSRILHHSSANTGGVAPDPGPSAHRPHATCACPCDQVLPELSLVPQIKLKHLISLRPRASRFFSKAFSSSVSLSINSKMLRR